MADEKLQYSFTGDTSSLRAATEQAISSLNKYEGAIKKLATSDGLEVGKTAFKGFETTLNGVIKQVNSLSSYMDKIAGSNQNAFTPNAGAINSAYKSITDSLTFLQSSSKVTSEDLKIVTSVLNDAKSVLDPVATKAMALGTNFASAAQMSEQATNQISTATENTAQKTTTSVKTIGQQWDDYANRTLKSAELSAQVFNNAGQFTGFKTGVDNVVTKVVLMKSRLTESMNQMIARIKSMSKPFDPLVAKIQSFKTNAQTAGKGVAQVFTVVASAFRRTSTDADKADESQKKLGKDSEQTAEKVKKGSDSAKKASSSFNSFGSTVSKVAQKISQGVSGITKTLGSIKGSIGSVTNAFFALAGVDLGSSLSNAAKGAIDFVENFNLFEVAMGDSIEMGKEFVSQMQEVYGMDPSNLYRYAGNFYQLTDAIGMCEEASATVSLSLTKAANDLSSLFNTDIETVVSDLSSGMQGMARTVRKYGMDIRATTIQQTAYKYGLEGNVEEMSEANRQALRYITMLEQAQNAVNQTTKSVDGSTETMGDFARNIETPANQLRIFKEQMSQLGRAIGTFIVAPLQKVLPYINGFVMALRTAITALSSLLGVSVKSGSSLNSAGDAVKGIGNEASKAAKKMKQLTAPFDELNVLSEESSDSAGGYSADSMLDPKLEEALSNMSLSLDNVKMKANEVRDSLLNAFGFKINADGEVEWSKDLFKESLLEMFPTWSSTINEAFNAWDAGGFGQLAGVIISGALGKFADYISWENIGKKVTGVISIIQAFLNAAVTTLSGQDIGGAIGETLNSAIQVGLTFVTGFDWNSLGTLIGSTINNIFTSIDWAGAGQWFAAIPNALIQTLAGLTSTIDWATVATSLATAITSMFESLDYNSFVQTAINLLTGALTLLSTLIPAIIEAGASLLSGLAQGFTDNFPTFVEQLPGLIQTFIDGITTSLPKFIDAALQLITALATGLIEALPTLIASVPVIIQGLIDVLLDAIPSIMDAGVQLITTLFDNIDDILLPLINAIGNIVGQLIGAILALIPDIIRCGVDLLVSLVGALPEIITTLVRAVPELITGLITGILAHLPEILEAGVKLIAGLVGDIPGIIFELVKAIPDIVKGIIKSLINCKDQFVDCGKDLIKGLSKGFDDTKNWLKDKVTGFINGVVTWFKDLFGIHSPSTITADMGMNLIKGLWNGINDTAKWLKDKISGFVGGVVDNIKDFFGIHSPSKETYWMGEMLTEGLGNAIEDTAKVVLKATDAMCDDISASLGSISSDVEAAQKSLGSMNTKVITNVGTALTPISGPTGSIISSTTSGDSLKQFHDTNNTQQSDTSSGATDTENTPMEVRVFIGDKEYDAYTYKASERGKKIVGKQPIKIGG